MELLRAADTAMYRAKRSGRNRWERFDDPRPDDGLDHGSRLKEALGHGVLDGDIAAWFQPIVELGTRAVVGHEALARWRHPDRGVLRPAQFMPAAEERGLSARVDEAVLAQACAFLALDPSSPGLRVGEPLARHGPATPLSANGCGPPSAPVTSIRPG